MRNQERRDTLDNLAVSAFALEGVAEAAVIEDVGIALGNAARDVHAIGRAERQRKVTGDLPEDFEEQPDRFRGEAGLRGGREDLLRPQPVAGMATQLAQRRVDILDAGTGDKAFGGHPLEPLAQHPEDLDLQVRLGRKPDVTALARNRYQLVTPAAQTRHAETGPGAEDRQVERPTAEVGARQATDCAAVFGPDKGYRVGDCLEVVEQAHGVDVEFGGQLGTRELPVIVGDIDTAVDDRARGRKAHGIGYRDTDLVEVMPDRLVRGFKFGTLELDDVMEARMRMIGQRESRVGTTNIANQQGKISHRPRTSSESKTEA